MNQSFFQVWLKESDPDFKPPDSFSFGGLWKIPIEDIKKEVTFNFEKFNNSQIQLKTLTFSFLNPLSLANDNVPVTILIQFPVAQQYPMINLFEIYNKNDPTKSFRQKTQVVFNQNASYSYLTFRLLWKDLAQCGDNGSIYVSFEMKHVKEIQIPPISLSDILARKQQEIKEIPHCIPAHIIDEEDIFEKKPEEIIYLSFQEYQNKEELEKYLKSEYGLKKTNLSFVKTLTNEGAEIKVTQNK